MRQVFTSPRLENVERVAAMLADAGIDTRIRNGRSYKGNQRADFSYREVEGKKGQPELWVIRSEDQPQARAMLRAAGLMDSTRYAPDSPMALSHRGEDPYAATPAQKRAVRMRIGLLAVITVILVLALLHGGGTPTADDAAPVVGAVRAPTAGAASGDAGDAVLDGPVVAATPAADAAPVRNPVKPTPLALAVAVLADALSPGNPLGTTDAGVACIGLDGRDATQALLAQLDATARRRVPASQCRSPTPGTSSIVTATGEQAFFVEVGAYRPAAAGGASRATVQRSVFGREAAPDDATLDVEQSAQGWTFALPAQGGTATP